MYIIKVLGEVHEYEQIEDLIQKLIDKAEFYYMYRFDCEEYEEYKEAYEKMEAYEKAILECFRLAAMK